MNKRPSKIQIQRRKEQREVVTFRTKGREFLRWLARDDDQSGIYEDDIKALRYSKTMQDVADVVSKHDHSGLFMAFCLGQID